MCLPGWKFAVVVATDTQLDLKSDLDMLAEHMEEECGNTSVLFATGMGLAQEVQMRGAGPWEVGRFRQLLG